MSAAHHTVNHIPTFPMVCLYITDYAGNVYSVDAECSVCSLVGSNVSSISVLCSGDVCVDRACSDGSSGDSGVSSVLGEPVILHATSDPAADSQRHLLHIFTRTSLIQHIRPHALHTMYRLRTNNTLHVPVNILVRHNTDNNVHAFTDTDLQRRRKRLYNTHTGYVDIQLPPTQHTLLHTGNMVVSMSTKHVHVSDFMRDRNTATHVTKSSDGLLHFLPYLCNAFNNTLHNTVDCYDVPTAQVHINSATSVTDAHSLQTICTTLLHTLSTQLLRTTRSTTTYTALLIA